MVRPLKTNEKIKNSSEDTVYKIPQTTFQWRPPPLVSRFNVNGTTAGPGYLEVD
jgi:hypothetical protein